MFYFLALVIFLGRLTLSATELVFLHVVSRDKPEPVNLCAEKIAGQVQNLTSAPSKNLQHAVVLRDLEKICSGASGQLAETVVLYRNCVTKNKGPSCQWCKDVQRIKKSMNEGTVKTIILYNHFVDQIEESPKLNASGNIKLANFPNITFINANLKPIRKKIPYQSPIRGDYFKPEFDKMASTVDTITPWTRRYFSEDETADRIGRSAIAFTVLTLVATVTVFLGSKTGGALGYQFYLKALSVRKKEIAMAILRRAMERKRRREELGLTPINVREILQQNAENDQMKGNEKDNLNANNNRLNEKKLSIKNETRAQPIKNQKCQERCNLWLVITAIIGTVLMASILIVFWLLRSYVFDILDVVFILTSISVMVVINPILKAMPCGCGRKKFVCFLPNCCNKKVGNDDGIDDKDSINERLEKYFSLSSMESVGKRKCLSINIGQIFGVFFCLGLGVIWYLWRMDFECIWGLHMFISCCISCACAVIFSQSLLPKYQYVVFLSIGFLIYDVFMVHITPLFTKNKKSIMIEVAVQPATDGNLDRLLAFLLYFPDYFPKTSHTCMGVTQGAILGYGDLAIATIIMEFTFLYENVTTGRPKKKCTSYEIVCVICYFMAVGLCFCVSSLTKSPMPALEFIVPFLLLGVFLNAARRREVKRLWTLDYAEYPDYLELQRQVRSELISMKQRLVDEMDDDQEEGEGQQKEAESRDHPSTWNEPRQQSEVGHLPASSPNKPVFDEKSSRAASGMASTSRR